MESKKDDYFVDGFLIRHFNIFPANFDKENLFEEQKIFLIYLMGIIPDFDSWRLNVDYKIRLDEIKKMKSVKIDDTILDMARLQEKDLKQVEREELLKEKKKKIKELNKKFGIDEDEIVIEKTVETKEDIHDNNPARLWEILQGKGLVK